MRSIRIRNTDVQKEICGIANCQGIARELQERRGIDQGPEEWMMAATEGLKEQMKADGRVTHDCEEPTMACAEAGMVRGT
eukprot:12444468-Alexandrium_andersonii.AAC.1